MPRSPLVAVGLALVTALLLVPVAARTTPRLGREVVPLDERVSLTLDPGTPRYRGEVRVTLEVPEPTDTFRLHALGLTLDSLVLRRDDARLATRWQIKDGVLAVRCARPLVPGQHVLTIGFSAAFDTTALALYRVRQGADWYAFTQFEAIEARRAFPCWDEPDFKIPWTVELRAPRADVVAANTPIATQRVDGAWQTVTFERTPPLPSYLVAFTVGPFDTLSIRGLPGPGRILSPRGTRALASAAAAEAGPLLAALERWFGRPYPYRKLDLVAAPEFAYGAMENAGLIVYLDAVLLKAADRMSPADHRAMTGTIAHEMAHMWFGDLVTMRWWDDLWLNESFASYLGDHVTEQVHPATRMHLEQLRGRATAFAADGLASTHAMRRPIGDHVALDQLADALAYRKGQALLLMYEAWLGPDRFRDGVREYLRTHAWGNAVGPELWSTLEVTSGEPVAASMASFLDQPGVPEVAIESVDGDRITLVQRRFYETASGDTGTGTWRIPMVLGLWDGHRIHHQRLMLEQSRQTFTLAVRDPAWVHPNADETGYYRWRVPAAMLDRIAAAGPAALTERERVALPDAALAGLAAGELHGDAAVHVIERLANDPAPEVAAAALTAAGKLARDYVDDPDDPNQARWLQRTFGPTLARLGTTRRANEPEATGGLRADLIWTLGTTGGDAALRAEAARQCTRWLAAPASVDPALAASWLKLAARTGDTTRFAALWRRLQNGATPDDRRMLATTLGEFRDPAARDRVERAMLSGGLRPQEVLRVPTEWNESPAIRDAARRWVRDHYDAIVARIPRSRWNDLVRLGEGCGDGLAETHAFFTAPGRDSPGYREELAQREARANACEERRRRERAAVMHAFELPRP